MLCGSRWKTFDRISLRVQIRLIPLDSDYKSNHETIPSLWDAHKGYQCSYVDFRFSRVIIDQQGLTKENETN